MSLAAIIVAAGSSRRMGFDKLLAPCNGKPVLQHSIETFHQCPAVSQVIVVCPRDRFEKLSSPHDVIRVDGGKDRHNSVAAGLAALREDIECVAVHDGARPHITSQQILTVLHAAQNHGGCAASARRITETVKRADAEQFITESVSRENLWLMETPQIFRRELLEEAYRYIEQTNTLVTDEVSALELIGHRTYLVPNPEQNPKITFPEDLS